MRLGAQRSFALEEKIDKVVGTGTAEVIAHLRDRLHRGGVIGQKRAGVLFDHRFQLGHSEVEKACRAKPHYEDRYGEPVEQPRQERASWCGCHVGGACPQLVPYLHAKLVQETHATAT